jgi:heavy metal sensor kinase
VARLTRIFRVDKIPVRLVRGLRFRLALSYFAVFALLLTSVGFVFRQNLKSQLGQEDQLVLDDNWKEARGYLRVQNMRPVWIFDRTDPDEAYEVERLRHVYMDADADGNVLDSSTIYTAIGIDSPAEIKRILSLSEPEYQTKYDSDGVPYLIKKGWETGEGGRKYFLALGRSVEISQGTLRKSTRDFLIRMPFFLLGAAIIGWILAGRGIRPVTMLAQAAQQVTGSSLSTQIPLRGAGDELDHLIESFNRMTERLHQSFEQIRRFSTDVSHELRTPLTAIRGQLEVALFTAKNTEQYRDAMVNALEDVEKLSSIVRALLLLSQAESGQIVLHKELLEVGELVDDIVDQFQIPAEEKHLQLTAKCEPGLRINADRTQIDRLLSNLLSNSVKYTPINGSIAVTTSTDPSQPHCARIDVADTGIGIPEANLPHIFDRFYRVRDPQTNSIQGLGLGLSFVAWIVQAHEGRIEVTSKPGDGACFTVWLPLAQPPAEESPVSRAVDLLVRAEPPGSASRAG